MKRTKATQALGLLLSLVIVITSITIVNTKADEMINKSFNYPNSHDSTKEITSTYYYSDDYFKQSSYVYNPSLATLSVCAASAAVGYNVGYDPAKGRDYSLCANNIKKLLTETGFDSFYANEDYLTKPTMESCGIAFAKKKITVGDIDYTLIAINFRNAQYEKEWVMNFDLGDGDYHAGFEKIGDRTIEEFKQYIQNNQIKGNLKVWITGYSKGAGIANYVSQELDDFYFQDVELAPEDVYSYSIGTPNTTRKMNYKLALYKNIFNIVSPYDYLTQIPPEQWGWHRFGVDVTIPTVGSTSYKEKKQRAQSFLDQMIKGYDVSVDYLPAYKVNLDDISNPKLLPAGEKELSIIIDDLLTALSIGLGSQESITNANPAIRAAIEVIMDATDEQKEIIVNYANTYVKENSVTDILTDVLSKGGKTTSAVMDALRQAGFEFENEEEIKTTLNDFAVGILSSLLTDLNNTAGDAVTIYNDPYGFSGNHFAFRYLAWLQSMDSNYKLPSDDPVVPTPEVKKPAKAVISKAKRKSSKSINLVLKKAKNAVGYQVKVYSSKKNANKNKKAIFTKTVKKVKVTLKSKKFKKKSKLYIRTRAYNLKTNKKKQYGSWSKVKKVSK